MARLPEGTLTFLLTDIVGSTGAWESNSGLMRELMARHDRILDEALARHAGVAVEAGREGDSVLAVFRRAGDAAACAIDVQRQFRTERWPPATDLRIRIALHTGEAELRDSHYYGQPLNRAARLLAICHGGQVLITRATEQMLVDQLPAGTALVDLGRHRLKDLRRPDHVFQLTDMEVPETFPRINSLPGNLTNLPVQLTEFIGRTEELRSLVELHNRARLVTLTGPGGVGKTRLALQLAAEVIGDYRDGVWLTELGPLSDPVLVVEALAGSLDLPEQAGRPLIDTLIERCEASQVMLILDNCEHLVEASADLVGSLLTSSTQVHVVATSREPLRVPGEQVWPVPPLRRAEAVRLFAECAVRHSPTFRLTEGNERAVTRVCKRLDDIPLAIELAAACVPMFDVEEIADRLHRRFALLTAGSRTASARHRTLQAVVDWSYDLLTAPERILFRRLSVFVGRVSLKDIEEVCADDQLPVEQVLELLPRLVEKSLVIVNERRHRLLETIRAYGVERLAEAGEVNQLRRRVTLYMLSLAEAREAGRLASWLDRLAEVHVDLESAMRWCADSDPELGIRLASAATMYLQLRGHAAEPRQLVETLLQRLAVDSTFRPVALDVAGSFAYLQGDFEGTDRLLEAALLEARRRDDQTTVLQVLNRSGLVGIALGRSSAAEAALNEALMLARRLGDRQAEANTLHHLGLLAGTMGDLAGSRSLLDESIDLRTRLGRRDETSVSLTFAAFAMLLSGDFEGASRHIYESLEIGLGLKDRRAAWSLDVLACLTARDGQAERALQIAGSGSAMHESIGNQPSAAWQALISPPLEMSRAALGPQVANAAWQEGRRLGFEEALELALKRAVPTETSGP